MSNKFLSTGGSFSANLTDGTVSFYGLSLGAQSLNPSQPIKTNSLRQLVSEKLDITDVTDLENRLNNVLSNPFNGTLQATDFETSDYFSVNDELKKIDNITSATQAPDITNMNGILKVPDIGVDRLYNTGQSIFIDLTTTDVDINATHLKFNGNDLLTTPYVGEIEATSFKKTGGTNIQYMMANGSVLTASANAGQSNFYLFNSGTTISTIPPNGYIYYDNGTQSSATMIYISHITRDNFDIEVFFYQITTLTDVYVQDQNDSALYIQYNITGTPTITAGSKIAIPVLVSSQGTTGFANGHNVFISFFSNSLEIDTRISDLESITINQSAVSGTSTTFTGAGGVISDKFVKSGATSSDILLGDGSTTNLSSIGTSGLSYELVPRGARDNWIETSTGASGAGLAYISETNILFSYGNTTNLTYSINGGVSFSSCTGLSTSVIYGNPVYSTPSNVYYVLGGNLSTAVFYSSTNGIAWTALTPNTTLNFTNIASTFKADGAIFENLIVSVTNATYNIYSYFGGNTWLPIPLVNSVWQFVSGYDNLGVKILVTSGSSVSYSYDGLNWNVGVINTGQPLNCRAVCYSSTRKEWIAYNNLTSRFFRSTDGKNWFQYGLVTAFGILNTIMWVGDDANGIPINQYYFTFPDAGTSTYALVYSPSCKDGTFRTVRMSGSTSTNTLFYSLLYLSLYDRFVLTNNVSPHVKYANKTNNSAVNSTLFASSFKIVGGAYTSQLMADGSIKELVAGNGINIANDISGSTITITNSSIPLNITNTATLFYNGATLTTSNSGLIPVAALTNVGGLPTQVAQGLTSARDKLFKTLFPPSSTASYQDAGLNGNTSFLLNGQRLYIGMGFNIKISFGVADTNTPVANSPAGMFVGIIGSNAIAWSAGLLPTSLINCIGIGHDPTGSAIQFIFRGSLTTGTTISTQWNTTIPDNRWFYLNITNQFNSNSVIVSLTEAISGITETNTFICGTGASSLATTVQLYPCIQRMMGGGGGTTNSAQLHFGQLTFNQLI